MVTDCGFKYNKKGDKIIGDDGHGKQTEKLYRDDVMFGIEEERGKCDSCGKIDKIIRITAGAGGEGAPSFVLCIECCDFLKRILKGEE